ncbi:SET domain-containing protein-lysine N-methyltransferase [Verrucomicrobiaceae bacterium R5-34]|uniref:SET domain-containing protein-lysine N-methyltransferase n=1 Tax=Oceaniferula flava TaxID=2800421 RepID=A0AAE2VAT5_9BACT|nr:SET domain-containing protein-lysine N-methyltransferase [Oceaniferula flavus]MBK1829481.1 SET domain-containing protein-lysine N-methyltransferase [Verrucomicrobiaceae bacterium R5-34]MBK1853710.1 SET domain-containing protein-lysine N-methyltransferase [Oceaniferula flavus]MBM1135016.1 SET domain-containing protein-lysine N-methyltransferase [Oceaniferula flavus]
MAKKKKLEREAELVRKLKKLYQRAQSDLCEVRGSEIHGRGVYATQDIAKETEIIEYVGEPIDKEVSEDRAWDQYARAEEHGDAAVYIFTLDDKWDIDGNVPWNTARLINHSCDPNCEAWIIGRKIFIYSLKDIKAGDELTFDYGFDIECYEDHPCRCGKDNCIGYIVSQEQWPELRERIAEKKAAKSKTKASA